MFKRLLFVSLVLASSACKDGLLSPGNNPTGGPAGGPNDENYAVEPPAWGGPEWVAPSSVWSIDYLAGLPQGEEQRAALCARHNQDRFALWYCGAAVPHIQGVADVLQGLGLRDGNDLTPGAGFALLAASNSMTVREVSPLNPRGIVYGNGAGGFVATAMSRGDNLVEIVAFDPNAATLHFYALHFQHACDAQKSCMFGDMFMAGDENAWTAVTAFDEIDLRNTAMDCLRCHEPAGHNWQTGAGTARHLLMQEGGQPWPHWLRSDTDSNVLLTQFRAVHPVGEEYAGIPAVRLAAVDIENHGGSPQALLDAMKAALGDAGNANVASIGASPRDANTPSDGWQTWFDQALAGNTISPPYWQVNPFDATVIAQTRAMYNDPQDAFSWSDPGNAYTPDAAAAAGITAPEGLDAKTLVTFKCGTCHNGLFTGITRNTFDVHDFPERVTPQMRALILERIQDADQSAQRMPPAIFGDLTSDQKALIAEALAQ